MNIRYGHAIDLTIFLTANLYNLSLAGVFLARARSLKRLERGLGFLGVLLGVPLLTTALLNAIGQRDWWGIVLPLPTALHCLVELYVDYLRPTGFRQTRWLWPYLMLFYVGQWFLVGYTFLASQAYGTVTLVSYFICLAATFYSYRKVKHG
jgi:hypothetical protein